MQPQAGAAPPQMGAEEQAYAAERGGMVEGGAPAMGAAPSAAPEVATAPAEPGMEGGEEDVIAAVADTFRAISKVRGEVWLVGDYLEGGISPEEFAEGYIEVYVSEPLDKQTILNGLRQTELAAAVEQQRLVFHENREVMVNHLSLDVSPGSQGYEPAVEGQEAPPTGEEAPEMGGDMMAQLGALMGGGGGMPPGMM